MPPGFQLSRSAVHAPSSSWTRRYIRPWGAHHLPRVQVHHDDDEADGDVDDDDDDIDGEVEDGDDQVGVPQQGGHS